MADTLVLILRFTNEKSCTARADLNKWRRSRLVSDDLSHYDVIKVTDISSKTFYFGLDCTSLNFNRSDEIQINGLFASKLGLKNNNKISVSLLNGVPQCLKAWIEPVSVDDWEILDIHSQSIERSLLDQIRVLWPGQVFPLWVESGVCIYLRTVAIDPRSDCGLLMPLTQLFVEPKVNRELMNEPAIYSEKLSTPADKVTAELPTVTEMKRYRNNGLNKGNAVPIVQPSTVKNQSEPTVTLGQRLLKIWILRRIVAIVKYVWNLVFRRLLPSILGNFAFLQVTSSDRPCNASLSPGVMSRIAEFPAKLPLVFRVEDTKLMVSCDSILEKYHQAGYALFNYSNCGPDDEESSYRIFLVNITKLPAVDSQIENNSEKSVSAMGDNATAVVRLFVQSMSKFAMFLRSNQDSDALNVLAKSLELSPVLRMQHKIGITSKIQLRKVRDLPKPVANNVKNIVLQPLHELDLDIADCDFKTSFENWIGIVTNNDNPLPITRGTIFALPVKRFLADSQDEVSSEIYVRIEKILDRDDNAASGYYLLSHVDMSAVEIVFVPVPVSDAVCLDDIDPKIPTESVHGLIPYQKEKLLECTRHCELVFRTKPITHKLQNETCHPGFIQVTGPSGIGKSYFSRVLLRSLAAAPENPVYVRWMSCSNLKGKKPETIKKTLYGIVQELEWRQPSALLLDDFDHLVPATSRDGDASQNATYASRLAVIFKEIFSRLSRGADNRAQKILVVITAVSEQSVHPALLPAEGCYLFSETCELTLPGKTQRAKYLKAVLSKEVANDFRVEFERVADITEGYAPKDYSQLVKRAAVFCGQRSVAGKTVPLKTSDLVKAAKGFTPISLQDAKLNKTAELSWNDIGGLEKVREQLVQKLVWPMRYSQLYVSAGMQLRSGILLYGPPGCGKTLIAGVVANECNLNFISVKGPELLNKYIGASEAAVRKLFARAQAAAPCLLFFDEFDSIAQKRGHDNTGVTDRVVNQFLTHLDGVEPLSGVYVLAATSRPDLIDPAILRPGRLDTHLHLPMPDLGERHRILECLMRKVSLSNDVDTRAIAEKCNHFTGADLRALVYDAQLKAHHGDSVPERRVVALNHSIESLSNDRIRPDSLENSYDPGTFDSESSARYETALVDPKIDVGFSPDNQGTRPALGRLRPGETPVMSRSGGDFAYTPRPATALGKIRPYQTPTMMNSYDASLESASKSLWSPDSAVLESDLRTWPVQSKQSSPVVLPPPQTDLIYFPNLASKVGHGAEIPDKVRGALENIHSGQAFSGESRQEKAEHKKILVGSHHFEAVLETATPSVSASERDRYDAICREFVGKGKSDKGKTAKKTTMA